MSNIANEISKRFIERKQMVQQIVDLINAEPSTDFRKEILALALKVDDIYQTLLEQALTIEQLKMQLPNWSNHNGKTNP